MVEALPHVSGSKDGSNKWYWYDCLAIWRENVRTYLTWYTWINTRLARDLNVNHETMGDFNYNRRVIKPF